MAAPVFRSVDLGFVEETDELWRFESHYFPSKVGGRPSWLALSKLPTNEQLTCANCQKQLIFLLQIYAPLSETSPTNLNAFHRTLFIFCCRTPSCSSQKSIKVFRSQLACINEFYSEKPPPEKFDPSLSIPRIRDFQSMCIVCGCPGSKHCGKCKSVNYCTKEHQVIDWKNGHKTACANNSSDSEVEYGKNNPLLFPLLELVMEEESEEKTTEKTEAETMAEYDEFMKTNQASKMVSEKSESELEKMASGEVLDKMFKQFKKRISREPEQVLRYEKGGEPLWVSDQNIPNEADIPRCLCGAEKKFEFQILPQLLHHLHVTTVDDCLDWGTLVVYTCSSSCHQGEMNYMEEFVWKQDFSH